MAKASLSSRFKTTPFASLIGLAAAAVTPQAAAKADGDKGDDDDAEERKKRDDETDDEHAKRVKAMDDKKDADAKAKGKGGASGAGADGGSETDEEKEHAAAMTERARCAQIVAHGVACGSVRQACAYAFDTDMTASVAVATLNATKADHAAAAAAGSGAEASGPSARDNLLARMEHEAARTPLVAPGNDASDAPVAGSVAAVVAECTAAMAKARGKA